jgi:hypothetical protein
MVLHAVELALGVYHKYQARVVKDVRLKYDFLCSRHGPKMVSWCSFLKKIKNAFRRA